MIQKNNENFFQVFRYHRNATICIYLICRRFYPSFEIYLFICLFVSLYSYLSIYLFIHLSICLFIYLFIYLSPSLLSNPFLINLLAYFQTFLCFLTMNHISSGMTHIDFYHKCFWFHSSLVALYIIIYFYHLCNK